MHGLPRLDGAHQKLGLCAVQEKSWDRNGHAAYNASKLAVTMWSYRLAKQLKEAGSPVTVSCVDPGTVNTKLLYNGWGSIAHVALPLEDADDEYWAATSNEAGRETGKHSYARAHRGCVGWACAGVGWR